MYTTIETLWKRHKNKSKIARLTGHGWKTVTKAITTIQEGKEDPSKRSHSRALGSSQGTDNKMDGRERKTGVRIHEERFYKVLQN